jgi:hypothetical protein
MELLVFAVFVWVLPIFVGHKIGAPKNRAGWAWGLLLGWLGVIIVACLGPVADGTEHSSFRLSSGDASELVASHTPPPSLPPAGWYADPREASRVRYWDGRDWTEHATAVVAAAAPAN